MNDKSLLPPVVSDCLNSAIFGSLSKYYFELLIVIQVGGWMNGNAGTRKNKSPKEKMRVSVKH